MRGTKGKKEKEKRELPRVRECCFSFLLKPWLNRLDPFQGCTGHLQNLPDQGFMTVAELTACHVPEDPAFPTPTDGYMVTFVAFYTWGFSAPSHRFLHSLLRYYGLGLHNLTPSRVLHIVAFMTLCEAFLGVDPEFNLWNYFFHVRHTQDPDAELTLSGGAVIHVKPGHGVNPYFNIPITSSIKGWWKKWFYLRNDASAPLPTFTDSHHIPLPSWGGGGQDGPRQVAAHA
jgi:hypothetical protein